MRTAADQVCAFEMRTGGDVFCETNPIYLLERSRAPCGASLRIMPRLPPTTTAFVRAAMLFEAPLISFTQF